MSKQDIIHKNAKRFNEDCVEFDLDLQDLGNNIPQSAWEMVAPNIAQDDRTTNMQGFCTLQNDQQEKEDTIDAVCHDNTRNKNDTLCMLYTKVYKRQNMNFQDYCRCVWTLNKYQHHIVMYNRATELHKCTKTWRKPRRIQNFSEQPRGDREKSCCTYHTKRHVSLFQTHSCKGEECDAGPVLCSAYRQLRFSLYSGAIMTKCDSSCYIFISDCS